MYLNHKPIGVVTPSTLVVTILPLMLKAIPGCVPEFLNHDNQLRFISFNNSTALLSFNIRHSIK